jgi:hypothetical protein
MLHVDDLIETSAEKVVMPRFGLLFRAHPIPQLNRFQGITDPPKNESKIARKPSPNPRFLAKPVTSIHPKPAEK